MIKIRSLLGIIALSLLLFGCEQSGPIQIGFVAGMSGRVADLGVAGRNGVLLAVEQANAAGGVHGRSIDLVVRDDEQDSESAKRAVDDLLALDIELIIGPMTSNMAMAVMPQINASKTILLSPTVTTTELLGKDDNFIRVISSTRDYAVKSAHYQYEVLGSRTVAAIYDVGNNYYTESWLREFSATFETLGGKMLLQLPFRSGNDTIFQPLAKQLLATKADVLVIVSNAVDSALLCQQVRKLAPEQRIAMSEWASTGRFVELAGKAGEDVTVAQFLDRNDRSPRYLDFEDAYRKRFKQNPGFAGLAGYDAALVALEAYRLRKPGASLKETILAQQSFQGGQQLLTIDRYGDSNRKTFVTKIRNGRYLTQE